MDRPAAIPSFVPSKTAKGLMAASGRPGVLSQDLLVVLAAVDGRSSADEIARRPDIRLSPEELEAALAKLVDGGFVRRLAPPDGDVERERLMEAAARAAIEDDEPEGAVEPAEPSGVTLESLLAEFSAIVNGAPVSRTMPRKRAQQLVQFAAERFAEQHRAMLAADAAREQVAQHYAALQQEIDRARAATGDAQSMPDPRRLFEAVLAREQQVRASLRDATARIADLEAQGEAAVADEIRRREAAERQLAENMTRLGAMESELATLRASAGEGGEQVRERADAAEARLGTLEAELADARAHAQRADAALAAVEARWREREAELERQHTQMAAEAEELVKNTWERGQEDLLRERRERNAEVKRLVEAIQRQSSRHADLEADRDEHRTRLAATTGEVETARAELARLRTELESANQAIERSRREYVAAFTEREELKQREQAAVARAERARAEAEAEARRAAQARAEIEPLREALLEIDREGVTLAESLRRSEHALSSWGLRVASVLLKDRNEREARASHAAAASAAGATDVPPVAAPMPAATAPVEPVTAASAAAGPVASGDSMAQSTVQSAAQSMVAAPATAVGAGAHEHVAGAATSAAAAPALPVPPEAPAADAPLPGVTSEGGRTAGFVDTRARGTAADADRPFPEIRHEGSLLR